MSIHPSPTALRRSMPFAVFALSMTVFLTVTPFVRAVPTATVEYPPSPKASVTLKWAAPDSDGGSIITGYRVYRGTTRGGETILAYLGVVTGYTDTAVTMGVTYYYQVTAVNIVGEGPRSAERAVTLGMPPTLPGAPVIDSAKAGNGSVALTWLAPVVDGGATITSYLVTVSPGGATCTTPGTLACTIGGLTNGTTYSFTVTATNSVGTGPASAPLSATPSTSPNAPTLGSAAAGDTAITLAWTPPASDGGAPITSYRATASPGGATCTTSGLGCTIDGLTNGTTYTFTVTATNLSGTGPVSNALSATPLPPAPPTARITALAMFRATTAISLSWGATAGARSGPVVSYDVRYRRAPWNGSFGGYATWLSGTATTSANFGGAAGYTYCFGVRAWDTKGLVSGWTADTCTVIPLDDRSLSRSSSWSAGTSSYYYKNTFVRSKSYGAKLTRTGVVAKRIALVATTCSTCGKVRVYWGSTLIKTISLYSSTTVTRRLIGVTTFSSARSGTLSIRVYGSGRQVLIDGVAIGRN